MENVLKIRYHFLFIGITELFSRSAVRSNIWLIFVVLHPNTPPTLQHLKPISLAAAPERWHPWTVMKCLNYPGINPGFSPLFTAVFLTASKQTAKKHTTHWCLFIPPASSPYSLGFKCHVPTLYGSRTRTDRFRGKKNNKKNRRLCKRRIKCCVAVLFRFLHMCKHLHIIAPAPFILATLNPFTSRMPRV